MKKALTGIVASLALAFGCFGATTNKTSVGASQDWVKWYVAQHGGGGSQDTSGTPTNIVSTAVQLDDEPGYSNLTFRILLRVETNLAYRVSDSTVAGVTNGEIYVWNKTHQRWENKNNPFISILEQGVDAYNADDGFGNNIIKEQTYLYATDSQTNNYYYIANDEGEWMFKSGAALQRFKLNRICISDARKAQYIIPPVVVTWVSPFTGELVTMTLSMISDMNNGSGGNQTATISLEFQWFDADGNLHTETKDYSISIPMNAKQCPKTKVIDDETVRCTCNIYEVGDGWNNPDTYGTFPMNSGLVNAEGDPIKIPKAKFQKALNTLDPNSVAEAASKHTCNFPPPEEEKHTVHERGVDCKCSYKYKKGKRKGQECGFQMEHTTGDSTSVGANTCSRKCGNSECSLYHEATHSASFAYGEDGNGGHTCACGGAYEGGWKEGHDKAETARAYDESGNTIVSYVCQGGAHSCGHTWQETEDETHEHLYTCDDEHGAEYCYYLITTKSGVKQCGSVRAHGNWINLSQDGSCKKCGNTLTDGSACPYQQHGGYWKNTGSTTTHYCSCGEESSGHAQNNKSSYIYTNKVGTVNNVYQHISWTCPQPSTGCGYSHTEEKFLYSFEDDPEDEEEEKEKEEADQHAKECGAEKFRGVDCKCNYVFKFGSKKGSQCGRQMEHKDGDFVVIGSHRCECQCGNSSCYKYNEVKHCATFAYPEAGENAGDSGHMCACGGSLKDGWQEGHDKMEQSRETSLLGTKINYICSGGKHSCGHTWQEDGEQHVHKFLNEGTGDAMIEQCYLDGKDEKGVYRKCGVIRAHGSVDGWETLSGECKKCKNALEYGVCAYKSHGGYWNWTGDESKHYCDCGEKDGAHGKTNYSKSEYTNETESSFVIMEKETWKCPDPPNGCGHEFTKETKKGENPKPSGQHKCKLHGSEEDQCAELGTRGKNCYCSLHTDCFIGHDKVIGANGCNICANENCECHSGFPTDGEYFFEHNFEYPYAHSLDADFTDNGYPPSAHNWQGHQCGCRKATEESHAFVKIDEYEDGGFRWIVEECSKCKVRYTHKDASNCKHSTTNSAGKVEYAWSDCVCTLCNTNRDHNFSIPLPPPDEYSCGRARCSNRNGTLNGLNGDYCSVTAVTNGGTHQGWSDIGEKVGHICECGINTNGHHFVTLNVRGMKDGKEIEFPCQKYKVCSNSTDACGCQTLPVHTPIVSGVVGENECPNICKGCGRFVRTGFDNQGNKTVVEDRDSVAADHIFKPSSCLCQCGFMRDHKPTGSKDESTGEAYGFCGCYCGTNAAPHRLAESGCYCSGTYGDGMSHTPVLMGHKTPWMVESGDETYRTCSRCQGQILVQLQIESCERCGFINGTNRTDAAHSCSDGVIFTPGTMVTTYANPDDGTTKEETGIFLGGGASTPYTVPETNHASGVSFYGGTFCVPKTGTYRFQCSSDDDGKYGAGPAGGESHLNSPSGVSEVQLTAGVHYGLGWSVSSIGGPCFFSFMKFAEYVEPTPEADNGGGNNGGGGGNVLF